MIVFFPLHKITKYKKKRYDRSDRSSTLSCHFTYRKLNSHACIYRLNLAAKNKKIKTRKEELVYASTVSTKSSIILKDLLIIQKRKLKMTYFLLKQQVWGRGGLIVSRNFSRELEFHLPRINLRHIIFHAALIHLLKIYFKVQCYW